jgi:hypothetical protein
MLLHVYQRHGWDLAATFTTELAPNHSIFWASQFHAPCETFAFVPNMGWSGRAPDHGGRHGPSSGAIGQHNSGDDVDPLEVELLGRFA